MQLTIDQLERQKKLLPVYLLAGDELFQQISAQDKLRQQAKQQGFDDRQVFEFGDAKPDWLSLLQASQNRGLFSERQLFDLRLKAKRPDKKGSDILTDIIKHNDGSQLLIITCSRLDNRRDKKAAWFKAIDQVGAVVSIWPIGHRQLPSWIQHQLQKANMEADSEAIRLLAERSEGNLLALSQEIDKLALLYPNTPLSAEHIRGTVADSSHYDIFNLAEACSEGDAARALHILNHLKEEGTAESLLLWNLSRELRAMESVSYGQAAGIYLPRPRLQALESQARRLGSQQLQQLLQLAFQADAQVKGQLPGRSWDTLASLVTGMAGRPLVLSQHPS